MRGRTFFHLAMLIMLRAPAAAQDFFSDYFRDSTLYIEFTSEEKNKRISFLTVDGLACRPGWNGPGKLPLKSPSSSHRRMLMLGPEADTIYDYAYSTLLDEKLALGANVPGCGAAAYSELHQLPFPKKKTRILFQQRCADGKYATFREEIFNPGKPVEEMPAPAQEEPLEEAPLLISGSPRQKVDLVILPQAYGPEDMQSFDSVARLFAERLLSIEPFKSSKGKFNIRLLKTCSLGTAGSNSIFQDNVFGISRYMGSWLCASACKKALSLPCDCFLVFVNSSKYAGGGIYNQYAVFAGKHPQSAEGMVHEFGHSFANLPDEYGGEAFSSRGPGDSRCIMRSLEEQQFCSECQKKILEAIKYWSE